MTIPDPIVDRRVALIETATRASVSLGQSVADKPDVMPIETNAVTLRNLGAVIQQLVAEAQRCAGVDCFGRSHDGIKTWVTRDWASGQAERAERYRAALLNIVAIGSGGDDTFAMLVDWPSVANQMVGYARAALAEPERT